MRLLWISLIVPTMGCSYKYTLDNQGLDELRAQQSTMAEAITNLQRRQDENDAKLRVLWTHGITK